MNVFIVQSTDTRTGQSWVEKVFLNETDAEYFVKEQEYVGDNYALHLEVTRFDVEGDFYLFNKMKQTLLDLWDSGAPEYLAQQNDGNDSLYMELRETVRQLK
jgi:hypothetical protein